MNILPIQITTENIKKYTDIAFLLDRDDFIQDLTNMRDAWAITLSPSDRTQPLQDWSTFPWKYPKLSPQENKEYGDRLEEIEGKIYNIPYMDRLEIKTA